jgi:hypothetical protein
MKPASLSYQILRVLKDCPDGLTCRQLLDRLPDATRDNVSGTLGWLARVGGVTRNPGKLTVFKLVPDYLAKQDTRRESRAAVLAAASELRRVRQATVAAAVARSADAAFTCRGSRNNSLKQSNPHLLRDQIAADVRAFESAGGHIERLDPGAGANKLFLDLYE